jgi:hypothetical protein
MLWPFEPERVVLSDETSRLCGARFGRPYRLQQAAGTFALSPIGIVDDLWVIGARLRPGRAVTESAIVCALGPSSVTLAPAPRFLVPGLVLRSVRGNRKRWRRVRELLDVEWRELAALHASLGAEDQLERFRALIEDDLLGARITAEHRNEQVQAVADAWVRLDDSPTAGHFAEAIRTVLAGGVPNVHRSYGAWRTAVAGMCSAATTSDFAQWWWALVSESPGVDAAVMPHGAPELVAAAQLQQDAARRLAELDGPWQADLLWPAVDALARAIRPHLYNGLAHVEAARALDEAAQPERAWDALESAAYWAVTAGHTPYQIMSAARWLAEKNGWVALAENLGQYGIWEGAQ